MKRRIITMISLLTVSCMMLCTLIVASAAEEGEIYLNGTLYSGTLAQAITAASVNGGTVGINGAVTTDPIGYVDDTFITNVTIEGMNGSHTDSISVSSLNYTYLSSKADVLTVKGTNVTIRNLTVDANYRVDFAIRLFNSCSNVLVENVITKDGTRGAFNILESNNLTVRNVQANGGLQGGFYFDDVRDASGITFENCTTTDNYRVGVLIRNGYGPCMNLDLGEITCNEGIFAVEDRMAGTLGGNGWADIEVEVPPKNGAGIAIRTNRARFYAVEQAYQHIRYGVTDSETDNCEALISTTRYGMTTDIYYSTLEYANDDVREGETVISPIPVVSGNTVVTISSGTSSYYDGLNVQLSATVTSDTLTDKSVVWTSSNPSIASISQSGMLRCISKGTTVITAIAADGDSSILTVVVDNAPVYALPAENSGVTLDTGTGFLHGIETSSSAADLIPLFAISGNGHIEFSSGPIGTGTQVSVVNDNTGSTEYSMIIVVVGDLNGDGLVASSDLSIMTSCVIGTSSFQDGSPQAAAADLNGDSKILSTDISLLRLVVNGSAELDQSTGRVS